MLIKLSLVALLLCMISISCTTVNIHTDATVGTSTSKASVDGSAWAQVEASSVATTTTAASTAGRSHPVSNNIVDTARVVGGAAIAAGLMSGNPPLAGAGIGAVAGSFIPSKTPPAQVK